MKNKQSLQIAGSENPSGKSNITSAAVQKKAKSTGNLQQREDPELKKRKERTHNGSTKPDKNHIW
jgi:hypothetical protein